MHEFLRYTGHAEAYGRQIHQQAAGTQLDLGVQAQAVLQEIPLQVQAAGRLALQQDQGECGDLLQGVDVFKVAGIFCAGHEDGVGIKAGVDVQRRGIRRCAGKGDVHLAGAQQAQDLVAAAGHDLDVDGGVLLVEAVQVGQQELTGDGVAGTDDELAHLQLTGLGQLFLAGLQQPHRAADVLIQHLALRRQGNAPGIAGKQTGLQVVLQLLDGLAHGGLGDIQCLGCGGDIAHLGHLFEYAVQLQLDRHEKRLLLGK